MNEERKKIVERLVKQTNDWFKNNIKIIESKSNSSLDYLRWNNTNIKRIHVLYRKKYIWVVKNEWIW